MEYLKTTTPTMQQILHRYQSGIKPIRFSDLRIIGVGYAHDLVIVVPGVWEVTLCERIEVALAEDAGCCQTLVLAITQQRPYTKLIYFPRRQSKPEMNSLLRS